MIEFPNKKFKVIYADPPWNFKTYSKKGMGRSAENHYRTMSIDDIMKLPVYDLADRDCVLLMWVTDPFLEKGFDVLKAWGFTYKTVGFYWTKENRVSDTDFIGCGYYTRANPEQCLLATRGKPKRKAKDVRKWVHAKVREHSQKPIEVYDRIERLFDGPYIELFARNNRDNWYSWGNETEKYGELHA